MAGLDSTAMPHGGLSAAGAPVKAGHSRPGGASRPARRFPARSFQAHIDRQCAATNPFTTDRAPSGDASRADSLSEGGVVENISALQAWAVLQADKDALLIDVRTNAEWAFVGIPDLSTLGRSVVLVEWQRYPEMRVNPAFCDELHRYVGAQYTTPLLFMCRSGGQSHAAALAMAARGFERCMNIADGFEGDLSPQRRRGAINGWRAAGLPWVQT